MTIENENYRSHQEELPNFLDDDEYKAFLPFSSLNYMVQESSPIAESLKAFGHINRLDGVRSLSLISFAGPTPESIYFKSYKHSRADHSKTVAATFIAIAGNNNLSREQMFTGAIASLIHDHATPALGDPTKSLDPENLHEEDFWYDSLNEKGRKFIKDKHISIGEIDDIIHNKGLLGEILDVADRITYTMQDVHHTTSGGGDVLSNRNLPLLQVNYLLMKYPDIGNIYKDVVVHQRKKSIFFSDSERLGGFLQLRAVMFRNLYMEPASQGRDLFVANLIKPVYSSDQARHLSPQILRQMTDVDLLNYLADYYGMSGRNGEWINRVMSSWVPRFESFDTIKEANKAAKELQEKYLVLGVKDCEGFDPGINYPTVDDKGLIVPFHEAQPGTAFQIQQILNETKKVNVFYSDISEDNELNRLLRRVYWQPSSTNLATEAEIG